MLGCVMEPCSQVLSVINSDVWWWWQLREQAESRQSFICCRLQLKYIHPVCCPVLHALRQWERQTSMCKCIYLYLCVYKYIYERSV